MLSVGPVMQMSVACAGRAVRSTPLLRCSFPCRGVGNCVRACATQHERVRLTVRERLRSLYQHGEVSELQPAGASCMIRRVWVLVPAWLTGTLVLAVKLVTRVIVTRRTTMPATTRAAITCCGRRRRLVRRRTCVDLPGAMLLTVALRPKPRSLPWRLSGRTIGAATVPISTWADRRTDGSRRRPRSDGPSRIS